MKKQIINSVKYISFLPLLVLLVVTSKDFNEPSSNDKELLSIEKKEQNNIDYQLSDHTKIS